MKGFETLLVEWRQAVATITVNRPDKLNALDSTVIFELSSVIDELRSAGGPRVVVLTGAGDKAFVAGADIAAMSQMTTAEAKAFADAGHRLCFAIEQAPFVAIASVNGFALGGGCELALSCDFIYASDRAKFGQPEVNLGLIPGFGGTQRLARRVGLGRARELVFTGRHIDASKALALGLVNEVVSHDELATRVAIVADEIASKAPLAIAQAKRVMARGYDADLATATELEAQAFAALFGSEDMREGTRAFLERRKPEFRGL
jgi:enoyl-CoA hydratase